MYVVCLLFYAIGGFVFVAIFLIGQDWLIHCSGFNVWEMGREFIQLCLSATPFEGRRRHIAGFGNKVWYYPPTGVGMYLN